MQALCGLGLSENPDFCNEVISELEIHPLNTKDKAKKIITFCRDELDIPMFYDQHVICKELGASATGIETLIEALKAHGFEASRTHFSGTSFRTDAPITRNKRNNRSSFGIINSVRDLKVENCSSIIYKPLKNNKRP